MRAVVRLAVALLLFPAYLVGCSGLTKFEVPRQVVSSERPPQERMMHSDRNILQHSRSMNYHHSIVKIDQQDTLQMRQWIDPPVNYHQGVWENDFLRSLAIGFLIAYLYVKIND